MNIPLSTSLISYPISVKDFSTIRASALLTMSAFYTNIPPEVESVLRKKIGNDGADWVRYIHLPLLVLPQDNSLFVSLLNELSLSRRACSSCYEPADINALLNERAFEYLQLLVLPVMQDYFYNMGYADKGYFTEWEYPELQDDILRSTANGWYEVLKELSSSMQPASDVKLLYDKVGMLSFIDTVFHGVPLDDIFA